MSNQSTVYPNGAGGVLVVGAILNLIIADIAKYDAFLHGVASIITACAAGVSIYISIKRSITSKKE